MYPFLAFVFCALLAALINLLPGSGLCLVLEEPHFHKTDLLLTREIMIIESASRNRLLDERSPLSNETWSTSLKKLQSAQIDRMMLLERIFENIEESSESEKQTITRARALRRTITNETNDFVTSLQAALSDANDGVSEDKRYQLFSQHTEISSATIDLSHLISEEVESNRCILELPRPLEKWRN